MHLRGNVESKYTGGSLAVFFLSVVICAISITCWPQFWFHAGWLNHDHGWYISQLDQLMAGGKIYQDVATPYGVICYAWHQFFSVLFGNTVQVFVIGQVVVVAMANAISWCALRRLLPWRLALIPITILVALHLKAVGGLIYEPFTVLQLALIVTFWRPLDNRKVVTSIILGVILGFGQWIKFGHFAILGAGIFFVDVIAAQKPLVILRLLSSMLRSYIWIFAGFLFFQVPLIGWVLWNNPNIIGIEALVPYYQREAYVVFGPDERMWGGLLHMPWKPFFARVMPAAVLIVAVLFLVLVEFIKSSPQRLRRSCRWTSTTSDHCAMLIPLFAYITGCFTIFSSTNHLWMYYWMISWALIWVWTESQGIFRAIVRVFAILVALQTPCSWVWNARLKTELVLMPDGSNLYLTPETAASWQIIQEIARDQFPPGAAMLFIQWHGLAHFLNHPPATRHAYPLPGWVRGHEKASLAEHMKDCWAVVAPVSQTNRMIVENSDGNLSQAVLSSSVAFGVLREIIADQTVSAEQNNGWLILRTKAGISSSQPD
jgi:hypothetical protein